MVTTNISGFSVFDCEISGVKLIKRSVYTDERGSFSRLGCVNTFNALGISNNFIQHNLSTNVHSGTVRGLHGQSAPHQEMKMITCLNGSIVDVVVDFRENSDTYLKHKKFTLQSPEESVVVPEGCLHGFQTLVPNTIVYYGVTSEYNFEHEVGMNPLDPALEIDWPLEISVISQKDLNRPYINY